VKKITREQLKMQGIEMGGLQKKYGIWTASEMSLGHNGKKRWRDLKSSP
jgi:hypothetical protein